MSRGRRSGLRFASEVLILQLAVVVAVVVVCTGAFVWITGQQLVREAESTALAIARTVAEDGEVRDEVSVLSEGDADFDPAALADGPLVETAERVRTSTGALFVVITDDRGIRLAHPDSTALGEMVSTSPDEALSGRESVTWETGTLGESARAKVPVLAPDGDGVVGEVSVGFARSRVYDSLAEDALPVIGAGALALAIGLAASVLIRRRLQRATLGLQPEEMRTLVQDQEAVLGGVGEGVLGLSPNGTVTVVNERARELLGLGIGAIEVLPERIRELAARSEPGRPVEAETVVLGQRMLFLDARSVVHGGRDLGTVVIVRDRTDVEELTRRLDAVAAMTTALRVQRHEFANRLHTVSGLLAIGEEQEARQYLSGLLENGPLSYPVEHAELVAEPYLQAFVGAKGIEAAERGVLVRIGPETFVSGTLENPDEVTTVVGNLLDNAVRAATSGAATPRWVELEFVDDGADLVISVMDSGDGVTDEEPLRDDDPDRVHGLGFGLPLSREIARRRGGDVWLASSGAPGEHGAVFCARLVGVVRARGAGAVLGMREPSAPGSGTAAPQMRETDR